MQRQRLRLSTGVVASASTHVAVIGVLLLFVRQPHVMTLPMHLPGTLQGRQILLTYATGSPETSRPSSLVRHEPPPVHEPKAIPPKPVPVRRVAAPAAAAPAEKGTGSAGDSAFGDENVRVALPQVHPRPMPDLSALAHGIGGDVIVDVVIDDAGKVTTATLVRGLGGSIDATVVQVLRDWTFTPATKNGQNIASEQEIIVHYERG